MAADKNEAQAEQASAKGGLLENKVLVLGIIVIIQAILAVVITQLVIVPNLAVQGAAAPGTEQVPEVDLNPEEMGVIVGLEEIIVTLHSASGKSHFLRINVNLEVDSQPTADLVVTRLPQLRDIVIQILSSKAAEDLGTQAGTQAARNEMFRRLAEKLPEGTLKNIFFSDLVIQ